MLDRVRNLAAARMKAQFEHVTIPDGCSIRVFHRLILKIPFEWHHHSGHRAGPKYVTI
jgi:hypothetical protein